MQRKRINWKNSKAKESRCWKDQVFQSDDDCFVEDVMDSSSQFLQSQQSQRFLKENAL